MSHSVRTYREHRVMSCVNGHVARRLLAEQKQRLAEFKRFASVVRAANALADEADARRSRELRRVDCGHADAHPFRKSPVPAADVVVE